MSLTPKTSSKTCEEASPLSKESYIACGAPATKTIGWENRTEGPYRMCDSCADHNIKNRGAVEIVDKIKILRQWLGVVLDQVDYTSGACSPTEMVGACLDTDVIRSARKALQ